MTTLTVAQLKKYLKSLPEDMRIFISSDEEGNRYSTTSMKFGTEVYEKDNALILYPQQEVDFFTDIAPHYTEETDDEEA
jgi:hypothetical protein